VPVYKDAQRGTWYCNFYYTDWQGLKKHKMKRGFKKQKDAKEWERTFLDKLQSSPQMMFASLVDLYMADMTNRLRQSTMNTKRHMIDTKLIPFFGSTQINKITPASIRQWQNELIGKGYADTYLKTIHNQLSAIFNYAVKYYNLRENPCHKSGSMGRKNAKEMNFWTRDEYHQFSKAIEYNPRAHIAFQILYWCGLRIGELLALTRGDIDFEGKTIRVNKSYQRIERKDVVTEPKTPKGNRIVAIPDSLCSELRNYLEQLYDKSAETRIFPVTKHYFHKEMDKGCNASGVKKIRVHDLRHPYVKHTTKKYLGFCRKMSLVQRKEAA
jgi:integrase